MNLKNDWEEILKDEFEKDYFKTLMKKVEEEYSISKCHPDKENIFRSLNETSYKDVKVVILGQDPYHEEGQAIGLAFAVSKDTKIPPSLKNIYKELHEDVGFKIPQHGDASKWAKEGVLLLNAVLTVRDGEAASHDKYGWQEFTDSIIRKLNEKNEPVVFLLWGNYARSKKVLITNPKHLVLEAAHPSPLSASRGFFGCKHFSKTNEYLKKNGLKEVDWQID